MKIPYLFSGFNLLLLVSFRGEADSSPKSSRDEVHIVYMGKISSRNFDAWDDFARLLSEVDKRRKNSVVQIYNKSFLGFAARLTNREAELMSQRDGVVSVFPEQANVQLHTTRSWDFLWSLSASALSSTSHSASDQPAPPAAAYDPIIGIIDSGIWPEHPSFEDKHLGPVPSRWRGVCMPGEISTPFTCNRKVIGARYYDDPDYPRSILTARDEDGHGTNTASIAAGDPVWSASYYGLAQGTARGGSPNSRIAVYRPCGYYGCGPSSILKAFDDAIHDGVDVISLSLGVRNDYFLEDPIVIGSLHAVEKGISVVCSAGNGGPFPGTVVNFAPWILTVGATTIDRFFEVHILLGGNKVIKGEGIAISNPKTCAKFHPLLDGLSASNTSNAFDARNCVPGSLDGAKVEGSIILCGTRDRYNLKEKLTTLKNQGAIGVVLIHNLFGQAVQSYGTTQIAVVTLADGAQIQSYINSTRNPVATIVPTDAVPNYKPAPVIPFFSARGPIDGIKNLLKPDITAPGEQILAAWPPLNGSVEYIPSLGPLTFNLLSGTSQSAPHVSALAAVVKSRHPTWTPSAIKSAIMTTAIQTNNLQGPITTHTGLRATPYDYGAGEINLWGPLCPGLVYETETEDYIRFLCNLGYNASDIKIIIPIVPDNFSCPDDSSFDMISDMNYPSIVVSGLKTNGVRAVKRTVTNVGESPSTYGAVVEAPPGVQIQVVPDTLEFDKNNKKLGFQIIFRVINGSHGPLFGSLTWSSGTHTVRSHFVTIIE